MKQTVNGTHEVFGRDNVIEVEAEVFQGDVGSVEIRTSFTQGDAPLDLSVWTVSVTNRAPNGEMVMRVGGTEPPLVVDGASVTWTLQAFDTAQAGTYTAQLRAVSAEQTVTVVFFRYNVERSVAGNLSSVPVQYATLSMLVSEIQGMRKELAEMDAQVNQMQELFDLFMTIIRDGGVTWDTLVGKPETFPPSAHSHDEFATLQGNINDLTAQAAETFEGVFTILDTKANISITRQADFPASGWTGDAPPYTQTVSVDAMTVMSNALAEYIHGDNAATEQARASAWRCINFFTQADGAVTAHCLEKLPAVDLTVAFIILG